MTGRGTKRRGRPPKTQQLERQSIKYSYNAMRKPKYVTDSQYSTPNASRASSPQGSDSSRRGRPSTSRKVSTRGRGRKRGSGHHSSRKSYENEYHYGSDFGDSSDDNEPDDDLLLSASDSDSLDAENDNNDSDFSLSSFSNESNVNKKSNRIPSPDPLWLQPIELPSLILPESSDDLLIPKQYALRVASIYEVFRRFKQLIRLSPFRLEDFCAALISDEQSSLLTEIHTMLLRALLREEDSQGTQFGPQDHKDSINITLYLIDQFTWPEVLRSYLESHESFDKSSLNILTTKDYPFVCVEDRLTVLQFLTDQFLITDIVRGDLAREVPIIYDDHCRICHKLGDLVCCETCPAVFHLECVDPPLENVPAGDYQCSLCKLQQVPGVYDCVSSLEKQGFLCRHEHLGYDRHGRKYWFINRRIFVEAEENGEIWYYSSVAQFKDFYSKLDANGMERALCSEIDDFSDEIERQMTITENLTNKFKGHKKSYLEMENQQITERIKKLKEKNEIEYESDTENSKNVKSDDRSEQRCEGKDSNVADKINDTDPEQNEQSPSRIIKNVVSTRLKTGSITPRNYNTDDLKRKIPSKDDSEGDTRMTRLKNLNINCPFKLGQEQTFKSYVNQYATNVYALNKPQRNEDRDKKRPLSHKFSLTQASEFKWGGILNGNRNNAIQTLRQTMISLEQAISTPYMHSNWPTLKKLWLQAISHCNKPTDFAKVLIIFQICTKNCIYVNAWHEQLAHIKLERVTSAERDEKKKIEKREKRERDDEEERNRLAINFVKYPLGQKHQVAKQKGEEYRIHGQWSWLWVSYGRRQNKNKKSMIYKIEPAQIVSLIKHNDAEKIITLEPNTYDYLKTQNQYKTSINMPTEIHKTAVISIENSFDELNVSGALSAENRLLYPKVAKKSVLDELLKRRVQLKTEEEQRIERANGSDTEPIANLVTKPRGRKPTDIEKLLRRLCGIKSNTSSNTTSSAVNSNPQQNIDTEFVNEVADTIVKARDKFAQLNRLGKQYKCYSTCEANDVCYSLQQMKKDVCFSPLCLQKTRVKEELLIALKKSASHGDTVKEKIMKIVNRKPEIKMNSLQSNAVDSSTDINPIKLQRNFLHALEKSCAGNIEKDVNEFIISTSQDEKLGRHFETCKMEIDDKYIDNIDCKNMERNSSDMTESIKMDMDQGETCQQTTNADLNSDEHEDNTNERMGTGLVDGDTNDFEMTDENSRERRTSRRYIKSQVANKASTINKHSGKCSLDSDTHEIYSITKNRFKDTSCGGIKSAIETSTCDFNEPKIFIRPNRRFPGVLKVTKREFKIEKDYTTGGSERIFSTDSTSGKIYLLKISNDHDPMKPLKPEASLSPIKYPSMNNFLTKKGFRSIMVLHSYELRKLARSGGKMMVNGFNPMSKSNLTVWPYPSSRPFFKTCWLFRTLNARTLATIALQLRIMWCCLRWDDMTAKPPTNNGKIVTNTETGIVSTEILKHRIRGRFSEKIDYLRLTLLIPYGYADPQPYKDTSENTPSRSGLRKRKRPETPQKTEKQVSEEWVDEDQLQLWEIKLFGERLEKSLLQPVTRTSTGKLPSTRTPDTPAQNRTNAINKTTSSSSISTPKQTGVGHKTSAEEIKEKMEQELRLQRAEHHKKRTLEMMHQKKDSTKAPIIAQRRIIVQNPDGTTKVILQNVVQTTQQSRSPVPGQRQKLGIIRGPDGKITSVTGLQPGQKLIESPSGLRIVTTSTPNRPDRKIVVKSELPKMVSKVSSTQDSDNGMQKTPIDVRQQVTGNPANVIVKSITNKTTTSNTPPTRSVILNNGQVLVVKNDGSNSNVQNQNDTSSVQKIITSKRQLLTNSTPKLVRTSNLQQLLNQGTQKFLINHANSPNKIIISSGANTQVTTQESKSVTTQQALVQNSTSSQLLQSPQPLVVSQAAQKHIQQQEYVNPTNQQQQIIFHGQRFVLNPGQRIQVTQQPTQVVQQIVQQPVVQQISQPQIVQTVQQQPTQPQQIIIQRPPQTISQVQLVQSPSSVANNQQQILVGNSLSQMLAQGKVQVATVAGGQQVIIRPIGNNQWHIVAHLKAQPDGTMQIVPTNNQIVQQVSQSEQMETQQKLLQTKQIQTVPQQQKLVIQPQSSINQPNQAVLSPSIEKSLLQGQPPGTIIKCVTAEVTKNQNGPCIKLTGIQGSELTEHQMSLVHQQVKQQLVKKGKQF
ncbi:nucleosome-remodeling factor subunit NURF301 isoform X2 [Sitodiplosis mosellana]|uniref:nucleosome-remodeling factor subunit NURF301 isoform X2 n=1 Tax=Sitodiplosis mosellana TaxID=263140 RepID=UPI0024450B45|nr:nucleosome-remodeling factor subunit NURF301 isoform X2 [Sitodiplosis mosellana]